MSALCNCHLCAECLLVCPCGEPVHEDSVSHIEEAGLGEHARLCGSCLPASAKAALRRHYGNPSLYRSYE